jgi:hypothetical protein
MNEGQGWATRSFGRFGRADNALSQALNHAGVQAAGVMLVAIGFAPAAAQAGYVVETVSNSTVTSGSIQAQASYNNGGHTGAYIPALPVANGYTGTQTGTLDATGAATSSFDQTTGSFVYSGGTPVATAGSFAAADLGAGTVRASAAGQVYGTGEAMANMADTLHFVILGASAATETFITVHWTLDGSWTYDNNYYWAGDVNAGVTLGDGAVTAHITGSQLTSDPAFTQGTGQSGWENFSYAQDEIGNIDFTGVLKLVGASVDLPFNMRLYVLAGGTDPKQISIDYSNTGTVNLILPSNVSYTSDSGAFLRADTSVPEPGTLALLGLGLTGLGFMRRRKA